jgi:hypothetical protein
MGGAGMVDDFGEAASASDATRTIKIEALDEPAFSPESLFVEVDDVVTFEVTNTGSTKDEFVLGDEAY